MIYTLTLTPYIEKRMYGKVEDYVHYDIDSFQYEVGGMGLKVSNILKHYHIDTCAFVLSGSQNLKYIKELFDRKQIELIYVETDARMKMNYVYMDALEDKLVEEKIEVQTIRPNEFEIINVMINEKMKEHSVFVFEYDDTQISFEQMKKAYSSWMKKCDVSIISLHPMYYDILKDNKANVLIIDKNQLLNMLGRKNDAPLSLMIDTIKEKVVSLSKIVLYPISCNDFLIFTDHQVYRVNCMLHFNDKNVYKEAILSGLIKCLVEDGDLYKLSEECLSMSVGMSLSEGSIIPKEDVIKMVKNKINVYQI